MRLLINGQSIEVASGRDAIKRGDDHDELIIVHERADGARLQVAGTRASGFVVDVVGGHTGDQTSASTSIAASAVATMFDRFAAKDTGWPAGIVWSSPDAGNEFSTRKPIMGLISLIVGVVAAVLVTTTVRRTVSVPWLCGRDDRLLDTVRLGGGGIAPTDADRCVFANGDVVQTMDLNMGLAWAELGGALVFGVLVFYVATRLAIKLLVR